MGEPTIDPNNVAGLLSQILAELRALREATTARNDPDAAVSAAPAEGLAAEDAAHLIGVSRSKFHSLVSSGLAPEPIQIGTGNCPRWLRCEIVGWLKAGAPARSTWRVIKEQSMRRSA
jgi:predicted DNA-binding transcriptional regulator AlpA